MIALLAFWSSSAGAQSSTLLQAPVIVAGTQAPPLVLLTMSRDEKLIAPAYNDYSDIDGDGIIDIGYKTSPTFLYFGNFSSALCYDYNDVTGRFEPASVTTTKKCSARWSGDFLNYVTTSRLDALRKALYGGKRSTDLPYETVLERAYVPQDGHVWGKEYDPTLSTYLISDYAPLAQPRAGTRHLFANVTRLTDPLQRPLMRILVNRTERIWNWVLKERPEAENNSIDNQNGDATATDYVVRNLVCNPSNSSLREAECKNYPGSSVATGPTFKPTGVLHDYGENKSIAFGLLSGSWANFQKGGVLRRNIAYFDGEIIAATGQFDPTVLGIVNSIDKFRISQFTLPSYEYNCNPANSTRGSNCADWANPVAEMMYEGLRYLASGTGPTPAYTYGADSIDATLGLATETWTNPYRTTSGGFPYCSKPIQMVVSDIHPTFDSDDLPGSAFSSTFSAPTSPSVLSSLDVTSQANSIWSLEGLPVNKYFIGHSLAEIPSQQYDQSPTLKIVTSLGNIRGLAPEGPARQGSYYAASVARFGKTTNLNTNATQSARNVDTYAIALSTPLPDLRIPVKGNIVTILPVAQSVGGCNYGGYESGVSFPTNRLQGFYITSLGNFGGLPITSVNDGRPYGSFRVGFDDNAEGTDNEMDAIVIYTFTVNSNGTITIALTSEYAAGCIVQHIGFVISGTTEDRKYLGVRDVDTACADDRYYPALGDDPAYSFQNPALTAAGAVCRSGTGAITGLGTAYSRTFTPNGNNSGGNIPHDPLWYAVKHGGPKAPALSGTNPEGYFLVTNPGLLRQQLAAAFANIQGESNAGRTAVRFTGSTVRGSTKQFVPTYDTRRWVGSVQAYAVDPTTGQQGARVWTTSGDLKLNASSASSVEWKGRQIFTRVNGAYSAGNFNVNGTNPPLLTDSTLIAALSPSSLQTLLGKNASNTAKDVVNYLSGDRSGEIVFGGRLRNRGAVPKDAADPSAGGLVNSVLGDIVNSSLTYQGRQDFGYSAVGSSVPGAATYSAYVLSKASRPAVVYAGANDGMLHAFSDATGSELWAFIPKALQSQIAKLAAPGYVHQYFVDGTIQVADAYIGGAWKTILVGTAGAGAKTVFALNVTDPTTPSVIWELDNSDLTALGNVFGSTRVTSDSAGNWLVVLGNGYESTSTNPPSAALIIVPLVSSPSPRVLTIANPNGSSAKNGLAPVTIAQPAGFATNGWGGDLAGRLYRISMSGAFTTWSFEALPMFQANISGVTQPISVAPAALPSRNGGTILYFGTGKYFETTDADNRDVQSFYSLVDTGVGTLTRSGLTQYQINSQTTFRTLAQNGSRKLGGYYVDLVYGGIQTGERLVAAPVVLFGTALFNTAIVSTADVCSPSLTGWQMALDFSPGGNPVSDVFGTSPPDASGNTTFYSGQQSTGTFTGVAATTTLGGLVNLFYGSQSTTAGPAAPVNCSLPANRNKFVCQASRTGRTAWRQVY